MELRASTVAWRALSALIFLGACGGDDDRVGSTDSGSDTGMTDSGADGDVDAGEDSGPPDEDAGMDSGEEPMDVGVDAADDAETDAGLACPGSIASAPYDDLTEDMEVTDPADCAGCPGMFGGLEELDMSLAGGATTIDVSGTITGADRCDWYVIGPECGILQGEVDVTSNMFAAELPVFCGSNVIQIVCSNSAGSRVFVRRLMSGMCTARDLRLTLTWDKDGRDMELHLIRPGGRINSVSDDCTWYNCVPSRGTLDWGMAGNTADNPTKDIDDLDDLGPENIFLQTAPDGVYDVMVEHWGTSPPSEAHVSVSIRERTVAQLSISGFVSHHVWHVGTVSFPDGTFTPIDMTIDCASAWGTTLGGNSGCPMDIP